MNGYRFWHDVPVTERVGVDVPMVDRQCLGAVYHALLGAWMRCGRTAGPSGLCRSCQNSVGTA
jgi:hypothetical protein